MIATQATEFIEQTATSGDPFFLYIAPYAPHGPSTPASRHTAAFADVQAPRVPSFDEADVSDKPAWVQALPVLRADQIALLDDRYQRRLRSLLAVDEMVSSLVETLSDAGELNNTYILFSSDNGYHLGEHGIPVGKQSAYDESTHVPLIVRGPNVPSGGVVDQIAVNIDLAPTFAELASAMPAGFVDGRSLVPLLRGDSPPQWRNGFLVEHYDRTLPDQWGTPAPITVEATPVDQEEFEEGDEVMRNHSDRLPSLFGAAHGAVPLRRVRKRRARALRYAGRPIPTPEPGSDRRPHTPRGPCRQSRPASPLCR